MNCMDLESRFPPSLRCLRPHRVQAADATSLGPCLCHQRTPQKSLRVCRAFLMQPGPATGAMQCFIVRHRGGGGLRLYPRYSLFLDVGHKFLAAARKRKKSKASMYVLSLDEKVRMFDSHSLSLQTFYLFCLFFAARLILSRRPGADNWCWHRFVLSLDEKLTCIPAMHAVKGCPIQRSAEYQ